MNNLYVYISSEAWERAIAYVPVVMKVDDKKSFTLSSREALHKLEKLK